MLGCDYVGQVQPLVLPELHCAVVRHVLVYIAAMMRQYQGARSRRSEAGGLSAASPPGTAQGHWRPATPDDGVKLGGAAAWRRGSVMACHDGSTLNWGWRRQAIQTKGFLKFHPSDPLRSPHRTPTCPSSCSMTSCWRSSPAAGDSGSTWFTRQAGIHELCR